MYRQAKVEQQHLRCALIVMSLALCLSTELAAQEQWLVLRNGQSIKGQVSLQDDRYNVRTASGSRIVIESDQVNFVADSISDIYWDKWSRVDPSDAKSHVRLFRWCLKHGLLDEAQKQIDLVAKLEHLSGQAEQLSKMSGELEYAVAQLEKNSRRAREKELEQLAIRRLPRLDDAEVPMIPSAPIDAEGRPLRQALLEAGADRNQVELVDFQEDLAAPQRRSKPAWVNNLKLDRETRAMPDSTVSFYKRHIERTLIDNCIGCHDSYSLKMPLSKRKFGQTIPRRMSQQNLHFVMEHVDRLSPFDSRILKMATTAHGDQQQASLSPEAPFIFELKKWLVAVSEEPANWLQQLSQESLRKPTKEPQNLLQASNPKPDTRDTKGFSKPLADPEPPTVGSKSAQAAPASGAETVDPYDPAAFNRQ